MPKSSLSLSIPLFLLLALSFSVRAQALGGKVGGISTVPDVEHNKEVQKLGEYSVEEYNGNMGKYGHVASGPLKFVHVVSAKKQVVSGIKYYLVISAKGPSGEARNFDAEVVDQAWKKPPTVLESFSPSHSHL